jgi:hypothetical protein
MMHSNSREEDLLDRGEDLLVHNYDGSIIDLKHADIWYNNDGNYVEPRIYRSDCELLISNILKWFCII